MQEINKFAEQQHLNEIYCTGFQLAFVSDEFKQIHNWVLCKDFMTDVIWATVNKKPVAIYGFKYNPLKHPALSTDPVRIMVRNKKAGPVKFNEQIQKSHEFLQILETKLGFNPSELQKVKYGDNDGVWMFSVDKKWIHASPLFSMLSLFLRVGCYYEGGGKINDAIRKFRTVSHNDASYLKRSRRMRHLIMKKGLSIFKPKMEDNYPNCDLNTVHNDWGIVNVAKCHSFKTLWDLTGLDTIIKKKVKTENED